MSRGFEEFTSIFFWNFKRMDNVNYNLQIIDTLFKLKKENNRNSKLNKPIILILAAIVECILYDFVRRITEHKHELIPGLDEKVIDDTKDKTCDQFEPLIAHVRKHDLLLASQGDNIYENLDFIRKLRNRIHIQNRQEQLDKDEHKIWTDENVLIGCKTLEKICDVLCNSYPRSKARLIPIMEFPKPWD